MRNTLLLVALVQVFGYGAPDCSPAPDALAKLEAYLSYYGRSGFAGGPGLRRFSFASAGRDTLFLQHQVPGGFNQSERLTYVFRRGHYVAMASCPNNPQWANCADREFREFIHEPASALERTIGPVCDFTIRVPEWRPSVDSPLKRRLASEVLKELMEYGYAHPREVYVRDFNVADPELDFYIIDQKGKDSLQGCSFDAELHPHCAWHLYGMSPRDQIKANILAQPYKLLPDGRAVR